MKNLFKSIEEEIKTLEENLVFLTSKKDTEDLIEELFVSVLNLRKEFSDYCVKLAIYKKKHLDKDKIYRKTKIDEDYIKERQFLKNSIENAKKDLESEEYKKYCDDSERSFSSMDLDISVYEAYNVIIRKFDPLIARCKDVTKNFKED